MKEPEKKIKLLEEIRDLLQKNETRISTDEIFSEGDELIKKVQKEADEARNKIRSSFDRIHDKLFTFNNMLIAAFLGFSKFPSDNPIFSIGVAILPIVNLLFLIFLEKTQMEIYRHESRRMEWKVDSDVDTNKFGKMINNQNLRSLLAIFTTLGLFLFLVVSILAY